MNTMLKTLSLAVIGSLITVAGAQAAGFAGASSDTSKIKIKNTSPTNNPHSTTGNEPGIQVTAASGPFAQALLSFKTYQQFAGIDNNIDGYKISTLNTADMPANHSSLGNFDFAQVPNQDVYFGEWTADRNNPNATHTVYYGGKNKADSLPNSGVVTYSVKGMNRFSDYDLLSGNLTANFSTNRLNGSLYRQTNFHDHILHINNNVINPNDASFSGEAKFQARLPYTTYMRAQNSRGGWSGYTVSGNSEGHFFGNNGQSLAGVATFENNRDLDTAFGGTKVASSNHGGSGGILKTMSE